MYVCMHVTGLDLPGQSKDVVIACIHVCIIRGPNSIFVYVCMYIRIYVREFGMEHYVDVYMRGCMYVCMYLYKRI
jgi:hypothetical protein